MLNVGLFIACRKANTSVGASLLAMVVNDNVGCLTPSGVLRFIASRLAPTGVRVRLML
jgi:hypothetical protein